MLEDEDEERASGEGWLLWLGCKTGGGGRGVKTHLFLDGCELGMEWRVAWEHRPSRGPETSATNELHDEGGHKRW